MLKITKLKSIFLSAALMSAGLLFATMASAETPPNIIVNFNPNPLFGAVNFLPGESVTAKINVRNQSGVTKPVAIEAINVRDLSNFGAVLNLEIKEGSNTILNKTLADFFQQGETFLSTLTNNASTTYDLIVTFNSASGNDYQERVLNNFDILVGFQGEQTPETPPGGGQQGGGSGGGSIPAGLTIFNEASINVTGDSATLTWQTNYLSTSRVIYSSTSEPHIFDYLNPPNYGYVHSSVEDPTKVTFHTVYLSGLTPGTTYYYRVISHASPDTVGTSYTFKTLALADGNPVGGEENNGNTPSLNNTPGNTAGGGATGGPVGATGATAATTGDGSVLATENPAEQIGQVLGAEEQGGQVAGALAICNKWPYFLWSILALIYLLMLGINYTDKIKKDIREKSGSYLNWLFALLPLVAAAVAMIFCGVWVWWLWLAMIVLYFILLGFYFIDLESPIYWRISVLTTLFLAVIAWIVRSCLC